VSTLARQFVFEMSDNLCLKDFILILISGASFRPRLILFGHKMLNSNVLHEKPIYHNSTCENKIRSIISLCCFKHKQKRLVDMQRKQFTMFLTLTLFTLSSFLCYKSAWSPLFFKVKSLFQILYYLKASFYHIHKTEMNQT